MEVYLDSFKRTPSTNTLYLVPSWHHFGYQVIDANLRDLLPHSHSQLQLHQLPSSSSASSLWENLWDIHFLETRMIHSDRLIRLLFSFD